MKVTINNEVREVPDELTVAQLVAADTGQSEPAGIAVAINGKVVPASQWDRSLEASDFVDILTAVQGG
ncbi:sulfur carrier protein ThiS [Corynebacterium breve]|uniref:Sulfur carrier protein ThiS n=1 Tax=Corynebacterium breve TaxID=3049799 RepID=A0ABY8VDG8_9CORY|nr:sulfur carrier protein ThiS [Corynebacterium breve]WIM67147.1 sulfur carrier protein ThiS [Corynebacterium breve]